MLASIGSACAYGYTLLEVGLAHPTFIGRLVSWGVFYGTLNFSANKIYDFVAPRFKAFKEGHCWCTCHKEETPKGEPVLPDSHEHKAQTPTSTPDKLPDSDKPTEVVKKK